MTSVLGHLTSIDFPADYKNWDHPPPDSLFEAPIVTTIPEVGGKAAPGVKAVRLTVAQDRKAIARNIESKARGSRALFIWTDCDREGEHIGGEIRDAAKRGNPNIAVKRAKFSNIERA